MKLAAKNKLRAAIDKKKTARLKPAGPFERCIDDGAQVYFLVTDIEFFCLAATSAPVDYREMMELLRDIKATVTQVARVACSDFVEDSSDSGPSEAGKIIMSVLNLHRVQNLRIPLPHTAMPHGVRDDCNSPKILAMPGRQWCRVRLCWLCTRIHFLPLEGRTMSWKFLILFCRGATKARL